LLNHIATHRKKFLFGWNIDAFLDFMPAQEGEAREKEGKS
jgi:hypothetical protein